MPLNIFDGSSWNPLKKIQIHDGSSWNESKAAYIWNGFEWKPLLSLLPKNTTLPLLSIQGPSFLYAAQETVQVTSGDWENSPTLFEYQWQKSPYTPSAYNWTNILDKTSSTLMLDEDEWDSQQTLKYVGYAVRCKVTATNAAGKNIDEIYTLPSPVIAPANLGDITVNVISNGIIEFTWQKVKGADDYYMQYQGPQVPFTEIMSMADNTDATKGVYSVEGTTCKIRIDTGSASGTLGILINPVNKSNVSGFRLSGYGKNATVFDLKPIKPSVTATMTSFSWGGRLTWSTNLIEPTSWTIYNNGEAYQSSYPFNSLTDTSLDIMQFGVGGTTFGSFTIQINGTAPRFTETSWTSTPPLTITYPTVDLPVNITPPTVSINGRVVSSTNGTWSNTDSIYSYITEWYSNGSPMSFGVTSPVDFGNNTSYDNTQITTSVYVLTTDLRTTEKVFSSNSVTMAPSSVICDSAAACNTAACKACVTTTTGTRSVATSICPSGSMNVSTCYTPGICDVITTDTGCVPAGTTWYCTESYNGGGVGNCGKTTSTFNNSASGSGYSRTCLTTDYPPCLSTGPQPTLVYLCTTSSSGAGIGNCSYTTSATNISASGTGYSTACRIQNTSLDYEYPACQSTAAPAKPSCPGTITNANSYTCSELGRTLLGGSSDYNIASNQQCCGDTIPVTAANCGGSVACTAPMCQACSSSQSSTSTRASSACASGVENTYICYTPGTCPNIVTGTGCVPLADIWYCTTSVQGAGVGNCGQSTSATNVSATGSGYNTTCSTSGYPACQSTAASGGGGSTTNCSTCNASGTEACGSGGTRTYCITPAGCADIYGPCNEPVFAPPSFPSKGFTPPTFFDPPFFPPTFFDPPFFPPTFFDPPFFPPAFKGFSPPAFFEPPFFPPSFKAKCLAPNALVLTTNGEIEAQHINVGDSLITISSSHIDINSISLENKSGPLPVSVGLTNSKVTSVTLKTSTLIGFNEMSKNYSVTQPIFIKSEGGIEYRNAGEIKIGDVIINVDPSGIISEISVSSIQVDEAESTVYDIRTTPEPWFIVNSALVIA